MEGTILKGVSGKYTVKAGEEIYFCNIRGILKTKEIIPQVGDYVEISIEDKDKKIAMIEKINERKNSLIRPKVSNIDLIIIVFSTVPKVGLDFLDKLILLAEDNQLEILLCINKIDLEFSDDLKKIIKIYENINYKILKVSTKENIGLEDFKNHIQNKITVLAGKSGVGKSSILKAINLDFKTEIGNLSKINQGKHTTTYCELIEIFKDAYIVDSPGFSTIDLKYINNFNLDFLFKEFRPFLGKCKFNNCSHINEKHCAVKENLNSVISNERYKNYTKFFKEIEDIKKY